ncbi:MAG: TetR/AcrR family transcriptional regulator [Treponema sp.]|nr:TetR/AcrR family transcriptional regulator [Treponema sp.]
MTKIEIINAAFKVWGRNFYRKTSLSQLAGELKVSKPALYRHFKSKQALNEAMVEHFLDDFAASIRADFEKALQAKDADKGISVIITSIADYFARNAYALIFSLMNIYERNIDGRTISERLKLRGADMAVLTLVVEKKYSDDPTLIRMIFATLTFLMSHCRKTNEEMEKPMSDEDIKNITGTIDKTIKKGLGYSADKAALDFNKLENKVIAAMPDFEPEPFFRAVAEAVAEAGPWDVSMEMVAKRLGLSKSSLYGHFKNKKDMLRRLFASEFKRIIEFAKQGIEMSGNTAEQLYLGIFSISLYLKSRPEILVTMDWIRTRKLDLGKPDKHSRIFRLFEDVDIEPLRDTTEEEKQKTSHRILFLLINILTNPTENIPSGSQVQKNCIQVLYKFITLGLGGFKR